MTAIRYLAGLLLLSALLLGSGLFAQEAEPTSPPPDNPQTQELQTLVEAARDAAQRASASAESASADADRAADAIDLGFNLIGLFEVFGGVISILAVAGGLLGVQRLRSLQGEMIATRERFEHEMEQRQKELDKLRGELTQKAADQNAEAKQALLALSLLPLGERQYRAQDFTGALDTYRRALELDPDNLVTHYRLGYVYTQRGDLEQAEEHLSRALVLEENFAPALAALGYVYRRMGEKMEPGASRDRMLNRGEGKLLEALEISPRLVDDDGESWWGSLGGLYRRRNQLDEAIHAYQRASEVTPHSSYPFSNLALLYIHKNDRDKMLQTYKRVEHLAYGEVQAEVDNYWGYADLLTARLALGKAREAEPVLDMIFDLAPADSPYVFESLTDTLSRLADVLGADPPAAHIREVIKRIKARM